MQAPKTDEHFKTVDETKRVVRVVAERNLLSLPTSLQLKVELTRKYYHTVNIVGLSYQNYLIYYWNQQKNSLPFAAFIPNQVTS